MKILQDSMLLSKDITQDARTNLLSIFNIVDNVNTNTLPINLDSFFILMKFLVEESGDKESAIIKLTIDSPSGKDVTLEVNSFDLPITPNKDSQSSGLVISVKNILISEEGLHIIKATHGNKTIASTRFMITMNSKE